MGCTESLPVADSYNVTHIQTDKNFKPLGSHVGGGPSTAGPTRIIVKEKLFSWSGDDFSIKYDNGAPFGNGLKMKGKVWGMRDQMTLVDGRGQMVAVCLRKFEFAGQTFKVYVPNPRYPGQKPSNQQYKGANLYTYCEVQRVPFSMSQEVYLDGKRGGSPEFVITRAGGMWPKKRLVKRGGIPATLMEGGTWETNFNSYQCVDPCLMICICAICDEMDEQN